MSGIATQVDGPVLRIVLDRPDMLNALKTSMLRAPKTAIDTATDGSVRVVVLTGAGRAFCAAGLNLRRMFNLGLTHTTGTWTIA